MNMIIVINLLFSEKLKQTTRELWRQLIKKRFKSFSISGNVL